MSTRELGGQTREDRLVDDLAAFDPGCGRLQRRDALGDIALVKHQRAQPRRRPDGIGGPPIGVVPVDRHA